MTKQRISIGGINKQISQATAKFHHRILPIERARIFAQINESISKIVNDVVQASVLAKNQRGGFKT